MFNPLLEDLTPLKDTELDNKLTDLNKKYTIAMRMGNSGAASQIVVIIEAIRAEITKRQADASKRLFEKQNKDLDGLINVG